VKLTQATVQKLALPAGKGEAIYFDDDLSGFGLRLRRAAPRNGSFSIRSVPSSAA
jgi:hypothetical protein